MSLIPHTFFPRRLFDMDTWMPPALPSLTSPLTPSTLDIFDPFDELDRMMSRNLRWFNRPESFMPSQFPAVPQKYRITVDCAGFNPDNVKAEIKDKRGDQHVLTVHGLEEMGTKSSNDYTKKEIKKSFMLPKNIEHDKMVSFMAPGGQFVCEFPMKQEAVAGVGAPTLFPQIVDTTGGGKEVQMKFPLPPNIDPSKVQVSVKDRDVIMRVEDKQETADRFSRVHIYNRTTLPENTDFNQLRCIFDKDQLFITAPVSGQLPSTTGRHIPLEMKGQQQIAGSQQHQIR